MIGLTICILIGLIAVFLFLTKSGEKWDREIEKFLNTKINKMKNEMIIDQELHGLVREFVDYLNKLSPKSEKQELTLEDCIDGNLMSLDEGGRIRKGTCNYCKGYAQYPNATIAEKVLLYGLLQSVAYKLNEGKEGKWAICFNNYGLSTLNWSNIDYKYGFVQFATKELAEQAIRFFENSKFDLKKLFQ